MLLLASFAASLNSPLGGFLWGVIIPLTTYLADIKQDCIPGLCQVEVAGSMV